MFVLSLFDFALCAHSRVFAAQSGQVQKDDDTQTQGHHYRGKMHSHRLGEGRRQLRGVCVCVCVCVLCVCVCAVCVNMLALYHVIRR